MSKVKMARSLPDPRGDCLVVEENGSSTSKVHWLTVLIDHVVVHSEDDESTLGTFDTNRHTFPQTCQNGHHSRNIYQLKGRLGNLSNMESSQRPLTVTCLTLAGTCKQDFENTLYGATGSAVWTSQK